MNYIIIPARLRSSRCRNKLLRKVRGKTILQRVWERCKLSKAAGEVVIASDSEEILSEANKFPDCRYVYTKEAWCGTDRVFQAAAQLEEPEYIVNVQGDYPEICPTEIDKIFYQLDCDNCVSLYYRSWSLMHAGNPHNVKVVTTIDDYALYFSRTIIPYNFIPIKKDPDWLIHIGVYGFNYPIMCKFITECGPSYYSLTENLEQLAWLNRGLTIKMLESVVIDAINTEADLKYYRKRV